MQSDKRLCAECERTGFAFDMARSALLYEGVLKELIHMFKYRGKLSLSAVLCEKIILFLKNHREIIDGADAILFVPLYNAWLNQREYNHSGILASAISREFGVPVSKALEKKRRTSRQSELSREERITNLIGLFRVKEGSGLAGSKVLLVDDVMTTGTTLNECAKTLKSSGVSEVRCLTLARGV
jgi:ComF family protein